MSLRFQFLLIAFLSYAGSRVVRRVPNNFHVQIGICFVVPDYSAWSTPSIYGRYTHGKTLLRAGALGIEKVAQI